MLSFSNASWSFISCLYFLQGDQGEPGIPGDKGERGEKVWTCVTVVPLWCFFMFQEFYLQDIIISLCVVGFQGFSWTHWESRLGWRKGCVSPVSI